MQLFPVSSSSSSSPSLSLEKELRDRGKDGSFVYLNVYDLTPANNYLYWFGVGVFHTGIEAHGMEYGFGAHEYSSSGVFEVEPKSCPGFIFRKSILLGSTEMSRSEFRLFMENLASKYHGDTYHLIAKNCNHFSDEVCMHLTGKPIPAWVNRLARVGSYCNCLLPENIQVTAIRPVTEDSVYSEDDDNGVDGRHSTVSSLMSESDEEKPDHLLLTRPSCDVAIVNEKPVRLANESL